MTSREVYIENGFQMQIAKVVPKIRTTGAGIFDYSIPPQFLPDIKIGLLVLVPFHNRKIEGVVIDIKRNSQINTLKPIINIIDTIPVVDQIHIELAKWMSEYYLEPFGKTLFENIVPPAKRAIKKYEPNSINFDPSNFKKGKKYLLCADFKKRLKFYLRAIQKTVQKNEQVIILVPDLSLIPIFTNFLNYKTAILHTGLTLTERWTEWNKIRNKEVQIIIGSNSALFSPANNLGLLIIDQEESETYKSYQSPRFHVYETAKKLADLTGANLIIGSVTPSITTYHEALNKGFLFKEKPAKKEITLVDMNLERSIISGPLSNAIENNLAEKQKILLILNRKGEGSILKCHDCGWVHICPQCNLPLSPSAKAHCANCEKDFSLPVFCPKCRSNNLQAKGMTTNKLKKMVQEKWPKMKIIQVDKENDRKSEFNWDLAIATNFALKVNFSKINFVALIDADQGLNSPDFRAQEINFQTQYKFLNNTPESLIQTHLPDNPYFNFLAKLDYQGFYEHELQTREKFHFPPFYKLIELTFRDKSALIAKDTANLVSKNLQKLAYENNLPIEILGPIPKNREKKRELYYQQIIIKLKKHEILLNKELSKLKNGWTLDIDPFNLL